MTTCGSNTTQQNMALLTLPICPCHVACLYPTHPITIKNLCNKITSVRAAKPTDIYCLNILDSLFHVAVKMSLGKRLVSIWDVARVSKELSCFKNLVPSVLRYSKTHSSNSPPPPPPTHLTHIYLACCKSIRCNFNATCLQCTAVTICFLIQ